MKVTVLKIYQGAMKVPFPFPEQATIDLLVGDRYLRKNFPMSAFPDAAAVQARLTLLQDMLLDFVNNGSDDKPFPPLAGGTVRDDLKPEPFEIGVG